MNGCTTTLGQDLCKLILYGNARFSYNAVDRRSQKWIHSVCESLLASLNRSMSDRSQPSSTLHSQRSLKTVRITLPPSPPPELEMESMGQDNQPNRPRRSQRISDTLSQDYTRVVLPTDTVTEGERLRSSSKWRQHDLALLKVKFDPEEDCDLSMLNVEHQWSAYQLESISPTTNRPNTYSIY